MTAGRGSSGRPPHGSGGRDVQRELFDRDGPDRPASPPGSRENPLTVSELNARVRSLLEERFPDTWVVGEVSNFLAHSSGHWYFTLKDARGEMGAVMFARQNRRRKFVPTDGLEVLARGRPTIYPARGRYQIVLEELLPRKEGELRFALRQLEEKLRAEGLFDPARRRPVPLLPRRIGVVTSRDGAAFRDILRVLRDRFAAANVILRDTRVQGEGAAADIAAAIRDLNDSGLVEVLIVGRGGGSLEDLWAFNEEEVVRAIAGSRVPVISAVGHEIDVTLSDMAADLRAATPSAAAEKVIASGVELSRRLSALRASLVTRARLVIETRRRRTEALARSRALAAGPALRVREEAQRLDELTQRARRCVLERAASGRERLSLLATRLSPRSLLERLSRRGDRLGSLEERILRSAGSRLRNARAEAARLAGLLDSLSPLAVLERGYAICFDGSGRVVVRDAAGVDPGDDVLVRLHRGHLACRVTRCEREDP